MDLTRESQQVQTKTLSLDQFVDSLQTFTIESGVEIPVVLIMSLSLPFTNLECHSRFVTELSTKTVTVPDILENFRGRN